jgi:plastocyanin
MTLAKCRIWALALVAVCLPAVGAYSQSTPAAPSVVKITVPPEDRLTPFAITVNVGQTVMWTNNGADDHTVVSNDAFNTAGHRGTNVVLPANGGTFSLVFHHPGVFPFYCRFHSVLDAHHQPKAPGPEGGIQDSNGNYGTPMNGVITVVAD